MPEQTVACKLNKGTCNNYDEKVGCGPACEYYNPVDGSVSPELEKLVDHEIEKTKNKKDITLKLSGLPKFDKKHEFMVMKKHVFEMQSISPKKIIFKFKRKLNDTDKIKDGCYVFVDRDDKMLIPHKVFAQFDRDAKTKREADLAKAAGLQDEKE